MRRGVRECLAGLLEGLPLEVVGPDEPAARGRGLRERLAEEDVDVGVGERLDLEVLLRRNEPWRALSLSGGVGDWMRMELA